MQNLKFKIQNYFIVIMLVFVTVPVFGAELSFDIGRGELNVGDQFKVDFILNTEGESINALEGQILFPAELLALDEIRDGNSIVNFWIERPRAENQLKFSGIIPGGYDGKNGFIFSLIFRAQQEGSGNISVLKDGKVLKNDGQGTSASLKIISSAFSISGEKEAGKTEKQIKDISRPESFVPQIASDSYIFEGKLFLVFATQDKESGIALYKIKETRNRIFTMFSKWVETPSPYILRDQGLRSYIFVKAIDKAGNEQIAKVLPINPLRFYENYENWFILIVLLIIAFISRNNIWRKYKKIISY